MFNAKAFKQIQEQSITSIKRISQYLWRARNVERLWFETQLQWQLHLPLLHRQFWAKLPGIEPFCIELLQSRFGKRKFHEKEQIFSKT